MKSPTSVKRPGRPKGESPKRGTGGKGRVLTVNVSTDLRSAIEAESVATGRSMSQVAEKWMELASAFLTANPLPGSVDAVTSLLRFASSISGKETVRERLSEEEMGLAVAAGWVLLAEAGLPFTKRRQAAVDRDRKADAFGAACDALLQAWERTMADEATTPDPVANSLMARTLENVAGVWQGGNQADKVSVHRLLVEGYSKPRRLTATSLAELDKGLRAARVFGPSMQSEFDIILARLADLQEATGIVESWRAMARTIGEQCAKHYLGIPFEEWRQHGTPVHEWVP